MQSLDYGTSHSARRVSRRRALKGAAVGTAGLTAMLALACGGDSDDSGSSAPAGTASTGAASTGGGTAVKGGTLRFVMHQNLTSLDPAYSTSATDPMAYRTVFDTLFEFDTGGKTLPGLVEKWEISGDGLTWNMQVQRNVKFHDGTPFNASAVKFNIDRILDPANKSPQAAELAQVDSTAAPDENTFQLKLKAPFSPLPSLLAGRSGTIFSPAAVQKFGADTRTNPVGTGPFKFVEFLSDSHFTATRNPEYWKPNLPNLDGVQIIINTDRTARVALLRSGQADLLSEIDSQTAQQLKGEPNLVLLQGRTSPGGMTMNINRKDKPSLFSDQRLRQAAALAIDPAAVVNVAQAGQGSVAPPQNFWYPEHWAYYTDQPPIKRDLQQSKQLLAAAGQPNGFEFSYILIGKTTPLHDVLQANLAEAGIKVTFEQLEVGVYADRNRTGRWDAGGSAGGIFHVDPGPSLRRYYWSESGCVPGGPGVFAASGFSNCEFDQLMAKGEATADEGERKSIYQRMNALWAEPWHSPKLFLSPNFTAASKNVKDAALFPDSVVQFHEAWITR